MTIEAKYVKDAGDIEKERLVMKTRQRTYIGSYLVTDTTYYDDESVSNRLRHLYWFPDDIYADRGDTIVLYTKEGEDFKSEKKSGSYIYFFYWGLERSIWNKKDDSAVIFKISEWTSFPVSGMTKAQKVIEMLS